MGHRPNPHERQAAKLKRKKASRAPYDRVLIVCEGTKTEPQYFTEIKSTHRLHTANVCIVPSHLGTSPRQVVEAALERFHQDPNYDRLFVVFDRDSHTNYHEALDLIDAKNRKIRNKDKVAVEVSAIVSNPCFELWLILHFEDLRHLISRQDAYTKIKQYIPDYNKSAPGYYSKTKHLARTAIDRGEAFLSCSPRDDKECFTFVGTLVKLLLSFSRD